MVRYTAVMPNAFLAMSRQGRICPLTLEEFIVTRNFKYVHQPGTWDRKEIVV